MTIRGIRGAAQVHADDPDEILSTTRALLLAIIDKNYAMDSNDIASIFFTLTTDLNSVHPALAARQLGWGKVPLLCAQEIPVPDSLPRVVRILIHWNTDLSQDEVQHVYLGETASLRPDLHINPFQISNHQAATSIHNTVISNS